jgi:hypothetical protein
MEIPQEISVKNMHNQTNTRIYDRNIPSQMLQPYIDVRPAMTKYTHLPIVEPRKKPTVGLMQTPSFNPNHTFSPGNRQSPWSGFVSHVNLESELRNQIFALQKCSQAVYVPSSKSDLYNVSIRHPQQVMNHSLLFQEEHFGNFNPNPDSKIVGSGIFYNSTRTQIQDMSDPKKTQGV